MSYNLSPAPRLQFFDNDGNPLVGGKLYTYEAGTSTPLATYTDSTGGTPNTNPVVLNSRGEANIWLGQDPYKFVLKTSTDTTIWTVDNVSSNISAARILGANGTAALPTYSFANDSDSGLYRVAAGQLGLSVDGKPVLRTTDAAMTFGQNWTTDTLNIIQFGTFNGIYAGTGRANSNASNTAVGLDAFYTNSAGFSNTAIGESALYTSTAGSNTAVGTAAGYSVTNGEYNVLIGVDAAGGVTGTALTTGDYNVIIGPEVDVPTASSSNQIVIGNRTTGFGNSYVTFGDSTNRLYILLNGSATSWTAASDARLKTDVQDYDVGLAFVNDLRPVTFRWKAKRDVPPEFARLHADDAAPCMGVPDTTYEGFIAQEVKAAIDKHQLPNGQSIWHQGDDGTQSLAPGALIPVLVRAIQELSAKLQSVESKLAALLNKEV
jgi:hypothetical protein